MTLNQNKYMEVQRRWLLYSSYITNKNIIQLIEENQDKFRELYYQKHGFTSPQETVTV